MKINEIETSTNPSIFTNIGSKNHWGVTFIMVEPLENISLVYRFLFTAYIVLMICGVLNVLAGVFLAAAGENLDKDTHRATLAFVLLSAAFQYTR